MTVPPSGPLRIVLVTGLSGAGKASILRALEDLGYEAVDNPPLTLIEVLVSRSERPLAVGVDARSRGFDAGLVLATLARLRLKAELRPELVFAWADESVLLRRYTETRRRHPLAPLGRVVDGIADEIVLTQPLRDAADLVLDTSDLPLPALRRTIEQRFRTAPSEGAGDSGLTVSLLSFAFPAGLPREADMVFDVRFLRNPHYDPVLRPGTGLDPDVAAYVEADPDFDRFYGAMLGMLRLVLPRFVQEGKKYATVAVGCSGGRHRSVRIVERLAEDLAQEAAQEAAQEPDRDSASDDDRQGWQVTITHRELARDGVQTRTLGTDRREAARPASVQAGA